MIRRTLIYVLTISFAFTLALCATTASAASSTTILRDALDGNVDGTYSVSDLRSALSGIPASQAEYYDAAVLAIRAAMLRKANPKLKNVKFLPVKDYNGNGSIDSSDIKTTAKKNKAIAQKAGVDTSPVHGTDEPTTDATSSSDDSSTDAADATSPKDSGEGDSNSGLLALLLLLPLAIIAFGVWRMRRRDPENERDVRDEIPPTQRTRPMQRTASPSTVSDDDKLPPTSSFSHDNDS